MIVRLAVLPNAAVGLSDSANAVPIGSDLECGALLCRSYGCGLDAPLSTSVISDPEGSSRDRFEDAQST